MTERWLLRLRISLESQTGTIIAYMIDAGIHVPQPHDYLPSHIFCHFTVDYFQNTTSS